MCVTLEKVGTAVGDVTIVVGGRGGGSVMFPEVQQSVIVQYAR